MTRTSIMDNPGFKIALIDTTRKTAEIAASYGISETRCRELRRAHGRPYGGRLPHGLVSSGAWQKYPDWVSDVRSMQVKALEYKYGWSGPSILEMRRQIGVGAKLTVKSKEFKQAIKTRLAKEVVAIYGVSMSAVNVARRKYKVTRKYTKFARLKDAQFVTDLLTMSSRAVAAKYGISKTIALYYRKGLTSNAHSKRTSAKKGRRVSGQ